jgi:hypothetical protein
MEEGWTQCMSGKSYYLLATLNEDTSPQCQAVQIELGAPEGEPCYLYSYDQEAQCVAAMVPPANIMPATVLAFDAVCPVGSYCETFITDGQYYCDAGATLMGSVCTQTTEDRTPAPLTAVDACRAGWTFDGSMCFFDQIETMQPEVTW